MKKWMKDLEDLRKEIHGGGTQERLMFGLIDAVAMLSRTSTLLTGVLIILGVIQVWLGWTLLQLTKHTP